MTDTNQVPVLHVGIFSGEEISFTLNNMFRVESAGTLFTGRCRTRCNDNKISFLSGEKNLESDNHILLTPVTKEGSSFILHDVIIGVNFHWQRKEDQVFKGSLKLIMEENKVTAVNVLPIEDYLTSVISSEMKATASEQFLKAHSVISRSWMLAQIEKSRSLNKDVGKYQTHYSTDTEIVRWYDREDHKNYDVCADDHCQRYQGITRATTPVVEKAVMETSGEVVAYEGNICDTRYYKCCGGVTELFENVWEPVHHPYLQRVIDNQSVPEGFNLCFENEENVKAWIYGNPDAFCNTSDKVILKQVLNDYDLETVDFFRWKVTYTQSELSDLIRMRTGMDFGRVTDLVPLERGVSGRIKRLRIEGSLKTMIIGKELEIRKSLSKSHLYSSCFYPEKLICGDETVFILYGAGWGHGVGLCQIGAAVMGSKGYTYKEILMHYFKGGTLEKIY